MLCPCSLRGQCSFKPVPRLQRGQAGLASHLSRQRIGLQGRLQRQQTCGANPFDLAWGTSVNIDAQVNTLPHLIDMPCFMSFFDVQNCLSCSAGCVYELEMYVCARQNIAANLFASSIIPYSAFLYFLTKSKKTPGKALFGFYFLLVFVFATIPAGIYGTSPVHSGSQSALSAKQLLTGFAPDLIAEHLCVCCSQAEIWHNPGQCGLAAWQRRVLPDHHKPVHRQASSLLLH